MSDPSPEALELDAMVDRVAAEMKRKLHRKLEQGYHGWDYKVSRGVLGRKLREHVETASQDPEQWLDVCNFAAMLYDGRRADDRH